MLAATTRKSCTALTVKKGLTDMGTRADFYVGRGEIAEWLGSIAWDGYPSGIDLELLGSATDGEFRERLKKFFQGREDVTLPEAGWPWPWDDSQTTDYAYAFDQGGVHASAFGSSWFDPKQPEPEDLKTKEAVFPDMKKVQNVTFGKRSGVVVVQRREG